jgi:excisionase family DNA binding protein
MSVAPLRIEIGPVMLRAADVATILRCDKSTVYKLARSGELPAVRIRTMIRFNAADVERLKREGTSCRATGEAGTCGATEEPATGRSSATKPDAVSCIARARAIVARRSKP